MTSQPEYNAYGESAAHGFPARSREPVADISRLIPLVANGRYVRDELDQVVCELIEGSPSTVAYISECRYRRAWREVAL